MNDNDMFLIEYTHPNMGKHPVVGMRTGKSYGYRGRGEQFLVHKDDIASQPHYFNKLEGKRPEPVKAKPAPPPPPPRLVQPVAPAIERLQAKREEELPTSPPVEFQESVLPLNLQLIPGVTPGVETALKRGRMTTRTAILEAGTEGLQKLKGIGPSRADVIYRYARGDFDPKPQESEDEEE